MNINFSIHYSTVPGRSLFISGAGKELREWNTLKALKMRYEGSSIWSAKLDIPAPLSKIEYKYVLCNEDGTAPVWEAGSNRVFSFNSKEFDVVFLSDNWNTRNTELKVLDSSAFRNVVFGRKTVSKLQIPLKKSPKSNLVTFEIVTPKILPEHKVVILGSAKELGAWVESKALAMTEVAPFIWRIAVEIQGAANISYKYSIKLSNSQLKLESGDNRFIKLAGFKGEKILKKDQMFQYSNLSWRGVGVAIPVFSLRTKNSFGVGEFADIKALVDWCKEVGINMIQILPVNDTISTHTWVDSYPYSGISVFALHPIYMNIESLGKLPFGTTNEILRERKRVLNSKKSVDYEAVMSIKLRIYKMAYDAQKTEFLKAPEFIEFFKENEEWLIPYAAYSYLRDLYGTSDYNNWNGYAKYDKKLINELVSSGSDHYDDIAVHYYIQYNLHKQLLDVANYARANGIVLKGDIPIGVNRFGVDSWSEPHLYNMDTQTGAPPDAFSEDGQNWGFPTYNWEEMARDNYKWWRSRLSNMARYFDAYRIDHILGFFRIWQIPYEALSGLLGHFYPAHPITRDELNYFGISMGEENLCSPLITRDMIEYRFPGEADYIIRTYFKEESWGKYAFKEEFKSQRLLEEHLVVTPDMSEEERVYKTKLKTKLSSLLVDVLFIKDKRKKASYHPRIEIFKTESFRRLDKNINNVLYERYIDYFYKRQEGLWRDQAMIKLPALTNATDMLVCGEDLGMVPDCVPGVMDELGILSLKIQRMPKETWRTFGSTHDYPYMSVCTPSCHDMSTIRGWWEEDRVKTQKYYNEILGEWGEAPYYCEPWIVERIIRNHLNSSSMWAVFPIQDLIGIDGELRLENPHSERINVPSNPKHYWKYRLHIDLEDILKEDKFNEKLKKIILDSGRGSTTY